MSFLTRRKISSIASASLLICSITSVIPYTLLSIFSPFLSHIIYDNYVNIMAICVKKRYDARQNVAGAWGLRLEAFFHSCRRNIAPAQVQYFSQRFNFVTGLLYHLDQHQWTRLSYSLGIILVSPIFYSPY